MAQTKAQLLSPVGIVTASSTVIGSAVTITSTGINASSGVITAREYDIAGSTSTFNASGINVSGVVTATSFSGNLSGNATGLTENPSITVTNAVVNGTLSVGGTSVILNAATLQINDKDITLGITTDANGNNVANDITANHGGISIASTVGTPIIDIPIDGVNNDLPTNKQIMWVKQNHYSGLGTDAWIFNYGVSIGNTATVQNGSRLTVGTGFTVYDAGNVSAGAITATSFSGNGANLTGLSIPAGYTELDSMLFG